jgi:antitoxin PrlF
MSKTYNLRTTRIGNSNGFRLPAEFYRDNPQFADADGWIEVISEHTAIVSIEPIAVEDEDEDEGQENSLMMRLFLDFAIAQSLKNQDLEPYTTAQSATARDFIAGVKLDDE